MEGGGEVHHFIMIYVTLIDIVRIFQEHTPKAPTESDIGRCYSIIEHEICDLGYHITLYTTDIRNVNYSAPIANIHKGLKLRVIHALHGVSCDKEINLFFYRTGKHFILMVK